eukprot:CAMPEP_0119153348 /NCGR_PEP_ID=MMETSP1310-20130426/49134_1 /TAXON_ID=464262 /ORGANISM="Genus nov. species nov., Strain RCC2339" /LENGTH=175 /DNA_ID=CAMNT_0007145799 /DNA_START=92 /DNA_END=619 /DNA_ORIENTATION=+
MRQGIYNNVTALKWKKSSVDKSRRFGLKVLHKLPRGPDGGAIGGGTAGVSVGKYTARYDCEGDVGGHGRINDHFRRFVGVHPNHDTSTVVRADPGEEFPPMFAKDYRRTVTLMFPYPRMLLPGKLARPWFYKHARNPASREELKRYTSSASRHVPHAITPREILGPVRAYQPRRK